MEDKKITMPAVALRGLTILPGMVQHFDISREKSIRAIETAMMGNQKVYLVTQRHPEQRERRFSLCLRRDRIWKLRSRKHRCRKNSLPTL